MSRFADIVATARATVGHIIRYISGGAVNEMPNRQYLDFAGNCTVSDDGTGIRVTVPDVPAGSVTVGNVVTLPAGSMAYVNNTGTPVHAILDFGIPRGDPSDIVPIQFGGTGADTAEWARQNLSVPSIADLQAVDNSAVHIAGTETITGAKTFSEAITGNLIGDVSGNAGTATKLETARSLQVDLASSTAVTFDGSADQNAIPVTGTLPITNGGTGLTTSPSILTNLASTSADDVLSASPRPGVTGVLPIANGGTGLTSLDTFVRTTDNQTITGTKTLTTNPVIKNTTPVIFLHQTDITKGTIPSANQPCGISIVDSAGSGSENRTGYLENVVFADGLTRTSLYAYQFANGSTNSAIIHVYCSADGNTKYATAPQLRPSADNTQSLGISNARWSQLFAGTATINTSDEREKDNIAQITDAVLDAWGEVNFQQYQFKDALAEKGTSARLHSGVIAQRVIEVFEKHNLDATRYGLLCHNTWEAEDYDETIVDKEAVTDAEGNIIESEVSHIEHHHTDAGDRYGIRYEEALCLEAAYQRRRADRLEARIAAIEARLGV